MKEETENIKDRMDLIILETKTKLMMLQNKQNSLDITKWHSALQEMKTEFSKSMEQRMKVNSEVFQDSKKIKDRIESKLLMTKVKLSKLRRLWNSSQMLKWKDTLEEAKICFCELLQERKEIKIKLFGVIPNMQEKVTSMMQEMKLNVRSQLQKMVKLDMKLVHQAQSNGMCPLDMNTEKWKLGLEELEEELLEDISVNQLRIQSELQEIQFLLFAGTWQEVWQWKPTLETMKQLHLNEQQKVEEKYSELKLLEKSQWKEMQTILQEAQKRHVQDDQIEMDSAQEETEKSFLIEMYQMQERQEKIKESIEVLRTIFEPMDLKLQDIQERIQSRQTKNIHKGASASESSNKALLYYMWKTKTDIESEIRKCVEVCEVQDWSSALNKNIFEEIKEMCLVHLDLRTKGNKILNIIQDMQHKLDSEIEKMQETSNEYVASHLHLYEPGCIENIESKAKEMETTIKSYIEKNVSSIELHRILNDMKSMEFSKNLNISNVQQMLRQVQMEAMEWEKKWELMQSQQQESNQEVDDESEKMGDLEKAMWEERYLMRERQELKIELLEILQGKQDITNSIKNKIGEIIETEMVKIWRTPEVQDVKTSLEQMHSEDTMDIQGRWISLKESIEFFLSSFEDNMETMISSINKRLSNESQKVQENQEIQDDTEELNITESTEKTSKILLPTININLSKDIQKNYENQMKKLGYEQYTGLENAKNKLENQKSEWNTDISNLQYIWYEILPELEDAKCQSALNRLKILHSKEKQRMMSRKEMIENMQMTNIDDFLACMKSLVEDVGRSESLEVGDGEEGGGGVVTLTREDYYTIPPARELVLDQQGRCLVAGFTISRVDYGNIHFPGNVNVAGINLDENVFIKHTGVEVYPDDDTKPPLGEGLNRPARITLDNIWPRDKSFRDTIRSLAGVRTNFEKKLKRDTAKMGAKFIEYRPETGSWVFEVEHFSKYGLDDSDCEVTVLSEENAKKFKLLEMKSLANAATGRVLDNSAKSIENSPLLYGGTKEFSSSEKPNKTQRLYMKPERTKEYVMADNVVNEFKEAFKDCGGCPTLATMKTTLITLFLGVLPSFIDLFSDINLGVMSIMNGDYSWGGKNSLNVFKNQKVYLPK